MKSPIEIYEAAIENLMKNGGKVLITYVKNGQILKREEKLKEFNKKKNLEFFVEDGNSSIPLLGIRIAVKKIADERGSMLYKNKMVDETYCEANCNTIREECGFGLLAL